MSVVLDGEGSAAELAEAARHLPGCEDCARFAAVVTEIKRCLCAVSRERPEALKALKRPKGEGS